jgi:hypothetical protein
MVYMDMKKMPENAEKFICKLCDFKCSKQSNFSKHLSTAKHLKQMEGCENDINISKKMPDKLEKFNCECGKLYQHYSGLWRHKRNCDLKKSFVVEEKDNVIELLINENKDFKNIILELMKNNSDLQKQMLDVCKTGNTNISNNNNKTFNMQFFLNEKCKDAMNIMDFVNSMTLEFSDLEDVGKLGYVEGISSIIIKKLNEMDIHKRPIHCSDGKREIMYVHDDNVWEKENSTYDRLRKAIKHITKKNGDMMIPWSKKYPACMNIEHHLNDVYVQIMSQCMGGKESFVESENKIMKKIAKAVLIDKIL